MVSICHSQVSIRRDFAIADSYRITQARILCLPRSVTAQVLSRAAGFIQINYLYFFDVFGR